MFKLGALALVVGGMAMTLPSPPPFLGQMSLRELDSSEDSLAVWPLTYSQLMKSESASGLSSKLKERLAAVQVGVQSKPTIYFIGDSLMRAQYMALCALVQGYLPKLGAGFGTFSCDGKEAHAVFVYRDFLDKDVVGMLLADGHPPPDVVYFDACLHMLHMEPQRKMDQQMFDRLLHFDEELAGTLGSYGVEAPGASLEVMAPVQVCDNMTEWADAARSSDVDPRGTAKPCVDAMVAAGNGRGVARCVCESSFFSNAGARRIAEAIREGVAKLEKQLAGRPRVVDLWKLTERRCEVCDVGGRHYNTMVLQQLDDFFQVVGW